jgi:hypothetical protein
LVVALFALTTESAQHLYGFSTNFLTKSHADRAEVKRISGAQPADDVTESQSGTRYFTITDLGEFTARLQLAAQLSRTHEG